MTTTTVIDGQSLVDIAIQAYGSVAGLVDLALRNGKSVTSFLSVGESLVVGEVVNKDVVGFYQNKNIKIATGQQVNILPAPTNIDFDDTDFDDTDFN